MSTVNIFDVNLQYRELKLAESYQPSHGGLLPDDPFWRYVEHRFKLAVDSGHLAWFEYHHLARFEHYHPRITPLLEENMEELQRISTPAPAWPISMLPLPAPVQAPVDLPVVTSHPVVAVGPPVTSQDQSATAVFPFVPAAVPEPSGLVLGGLGLGVALLLGWWSK